MECWSDGVLESVFVKKPENLKPETQNLKPETRNKKIKTMKKSKLNLVIDILLLILMTAIAGIGLIMKYRLLSGHEKWEKYGANLDTTLLGLDRHEWGEIHLILGFILIGLLVLHIWLHWNMIICIYKKLIKNKNSRIFVTVILCFLVLFFLLAPFIFNVRINGVQEKQGYYKSISVDKSSESLNKQSKVLNKENKEVPKLKSINRNKNQKVDSDVEIKGFMSIADVSKKYNIPADKIKKHLDISLSTPDNKRLGILKRTHNFEMSDLRDFVIRNQGKME